MGSANTVQSRFRWRNDDGTLGGAGATWKAGININWTPGLGDMDIPIRLRMEMANTGGMAEQSGQYLVELDVDGGGYNPITLTSTDGVQMVASAYVTDDVMVPELMDGPQGYWNGRFDSNGAATAIELAATTDSESEYCFKMVTANLSGGEVLSFRVYRSGSALDGYTNTPTITVPALPSAEWTQAEFRIRGDGLYADHQTLNANTANDWKYAVNVSGILQPSPSHAGTVFGLRFKVSAAVLPGSKTLKIQQAKNGGGWLDLTTQFHNDQSLLANGIPVGITPSIHFTDGDPTTQLLSGSSFVAGTGEHDAIAAAVTLAVGEHTELEWRIFINKTYETMGYGHVDGDYYDFRLVESDGTPLTNYTNIPRITLDYDNNYVGGCYPESIGQYGIYTASDGDAFTFVEESELTGVIKAMKRANGTTRWVVVDAINNPAGFQDLECFHVQQIGNTLHLFFQGGTTRYETFDMSTDSWGTLDEEVDATSGGINQIVFGFKRSDNTVICFYGDVLDDLVYKERSSGGVWDVSSTSFRIGTIKGAAGCLAEADKIYAVYHDNDSTIYSKSLDSSNVQGTERTISTDPVLGGLGQWSLISPVYWDDSGTEKIGVIYQEDTDLKLYWRIISDDGVPASASVVTDASCLENPTGLNNRQPSANALMDGTTIIVAYCDGATEDLYYTTSNNGATFATDIEVEDGVKVHAVGLGLDSGILSFLREEPNIDDVYPEGRSGFTGGIQVIQISLSATDDLTANSITTNPVLDTPTFAQVHVLGATGITTNPVVDNPTIGQIHALTATGIITNPVVDNPTAAHIHDFTATGITTNPVVDNPTLGQEHALTANGITATPVVDTPTLGQEHALSATSIVTNPIVDNPTLGQTHPLTATGILTNPVVDAPALAQEHVLAATGILTNSLVETPTIGQIHALTANDITADPVLDTPTLAELGEDNLTANSITTSPVVDTSTIGQEHALTATGVTTNPVVDTPTAAHIHDLSATGIATNPVVDNPTITHIHDLTANSIATNPVVDTPTAAHIHDLSATGITTNPVVDNPTLTEEGEDALTANSITTNPLVETPTIAQTHALSAVDITADPVLDTPTLAELGEDNLTATGITTNPLVEQPSIGQIHAITATGIVTAPEVDTPAIGQIQTLDAVGIETTPVVDTPTVSHIHVLSATGITTNPVVGDPSIGQVHVLDATSILVLPLVGTPSIGQTHILTALGIITTPETGIPSWDLIEGIVTITFTEMYPEVTFTEMYPEVTFSTIKPEITFSIPLED